MSQPAADPTHAVPPAPAAAAGLPVAADAAAPWPVVRVGDQWTFITQLAGSRDPLRLRHRVVEVAADGRVRTEVLNLRRPDEPPLTQWLDRSMNRLSREFAPGEAVRYSPAFALFRFPMRPGDAWEESVLQTQDAGWAPNRVEIAARVRGWERVEVPGGTFDALLLEAVHRTGQAHVQARYWYAPAVRRAVRGVELTRTPTGRSELGYELLEFAPG